MTIIIEKANPKMLFHDIHKENRIFAKEKIVNPSTER